jgi:hypothetical protein
LPFPPPPPFFFLSSLFLPSDNPPFLLSITRTYPPTLLSTLPHPTRLSFTTKLDRNTCAYNNKT